MEELEQYFDSVSNRLKLLSEDISKRIENNKKAEKIAKKETPNQTNKPNQENIPNQENKPNTTYRMRSILPLTTFHKTTTEAKEASNNPDLDYIEKALDNAFRE